MLVYTGHNKSLLVRKSTSAIDTHDPVCIIYGIMGINRTSGVLTKTGYASRSIKKRWAHQIERPQLARSVF